MSVSHSLTKQSISRRSLMKGSAAAMTIPAFAGLGIMHRANLASAQDGADFRMEYVNFPTLDPQFVTNGMWFAAEGLLEGLTKLENGGVDAVGAMAETWDVSEDGLTYTFHLRDAKWSNGDPVTSNDFIWTYQRLLTPSSAAAGVTLGANSFQPALGIVGAADFFAGALENWEEVGIKAPDEKTVEFTLEYANAEFPHLITHPSMLPLNQKNVESGDEWIMPGNIVTNGPFVPDAWEINANIHLIPNEEYWDRAAVTVPGVFVNLAGEGSVAFEAGELDYVSLDAPSLERFQADPNMAERVHSAPAGNIGYLATLRSKNPILEDLNIRKALSMAIDRDIIGGVMPNTRPSAQLIPDSLAGWTDAENTPTDVDQAKQILADAGYPDGEGFPTVNLLYGGTNLAMEALADIWNQNLGINVNLDTVESGVYVERRWAVQEEDYIGFYTGTFGSTPTWSTWVASLWSPQFISEFSLPADIWAEYQTIQTNTDLTPAERNAQLEELRLANRSPEAAAFDEAVVAAFAEPDPEAQQSALREAAQIRMNSFLIIPVYQVDAYYALAEGVGEIDYIQGGLHFYYKNFTKG